MSNDQTTKNEQYTKTQKPDFIAFTVSEGKDQRPRWTQIGAAWNVKNGQKVIFDALPTNGKVILQSLDSIKERRQNQSPSQPPNLKP